MKKPNLLSMVAIAVLMVFAVGCTTLQESAGGYEEAPGRSYRRVPYGTNDVIVVERDPYTGQYYQVSPYGSYGAPFNSFGYGYGVPSYRYPSRGGYYRGGGGNVRSGGGNIRSGGGARVVPQRPQQQQPSQRGSETTRKAKDVILGN